MIKYKIFAGDLKAIEDQFNGWARGLPNGVNVNAAMLQFADGQFVKEVMYVLPNDAPAQIAIARPANNSRAN